MSEYLFLVGIGRVKDARRVRSIAKLHGSVFIEAKMPEGWRHWFAAKNLGDPFDRTRRADVLAALTRAGLVDSDGCMLPRGAK